MTDIIREIIARLVRAAREIADNIDNDLSQTQHFQMFDEDITSNILKARNLISALIEIPVDKLHFILINVVYQDYRNQNLSKKYIADRIDVRDHISNAVEMIKKHEVFSTERIKENIPDMPCDLNQDRLLDEIELSNLHLKDDITYLHNTIKSLVYYISYALNSSQQSGSYDFNKFAYVLISDLYGVLNTLNEYKNDN